METLMLFYNEASSVHHWSGMDCFSINDMLPLESKRCLRDWILLAWKSLRSSAHRSKMQGCMKNAALSHYFSLCVRYRHLYYDRLLSTILWVLDLDHFTVVMSAGERRHSKSGTLLFSHGCYVVKHLIACYRKCIRTPVGLFPLVFIFPDPLAEVRFLNLLDR